VASSQELGIDAFCLLIRTSTPPAQPGQLIGGFEAWVESFGIKYPPASDCALPLNLVLTFAAPLVTEVAFQLQTGGQTPDFRNIFVWLNNLGALSAPG